MPEVLPEPERVMITPNRRNRFTVTAAALATTFAALLALSGCSPTGMAVGAGAEIGSAAMEERSFGDIATDAKIKAQIKGNFLAHSTSLFVDVAANVTEGKVFLTGSVKKPEDRIEAVKIAWRAGGVRSVVNEIQVEDESSLIDAARDRWISTKLRVKITLDKSIRAVNYNIDTVNGHIYLMGIAQNADELQRVLTYARATPHVRRIVSHVEPKDSRDRGTAEKEKPLQIGPFPPPETAGAPAAATAPAVTPVQRGGS